MTIDFAYRGMIYGLIIGAAVIVISMCVDRCGRHAVREPIGIDVLR